MWKLPLFVLTLSCLSANCQERIITKPPGKILQIKSECSKNLDHKLDLIKSDLNKLVQYQNNSAQHRKLQLNDAVPTPPIMETILKVAKEINSKVGSCKCEDLQAEINKLKTELDTIRTSAQNKCASVKIIDELGGMDQVLLDQQQGDDTTQNDSDVTHRTKRITEGPYKDKTLPLVKLGNGFYYFETQLEFDWESAKLFCQQLGLRLVSVETREENVLLQNYIRGIPEDGADDFWTSGKEVELNKYVWDSTGSPITFFDWGPGEPSHDYDEESVIHFFRYAYLKWNDWSPFKETHPLCEK